MLALLANISFALGTIFFTHYARKISSLWVNTFKALVACICFGVTILATSGFHEISGATFLVFFISGFIALGIGDVFLINAFSILGPGRTMVIFGFHPMIVGVISYFVFDQVLDVNKFYAITFFVMCLFTFSYETFREKGHWEIKGLFYALLGVGLDGVGVIITRYAFDMNKSINVFEGNFYRCLGAIVAYIILSKKYPFEFMGNLKKLKMKSRFYITVGALLGTYLSLAFYLEAIKSANLASVSAISITGVIFASLFECIWDKRLPSRYLYIAFIFFSVGMWFLVIRSTA
jgi:drug/metabolite transporter (DMT)-like permease